MEVSGCLTHARTESELILIGRGEGVNAMCGLENTHSESFVRGEGVKAGASW